MVVALLGVVHVHDFLLGLLGGRLCEFLAVGHDDFLALEGLGTLHWLRPWIGFRRLTRVGVSSTMSRVTGRNTSRRIIVSGCEGAWVGADL